MEEAIPTQDGRSARPEPATATVEVATGARLHALVWEPTVERRRPDLLLVHGLASNARLWDGVARILASRGHRCVAVDQRGHGRSAHVDGGFDFATLTADLVAVATSTGLERPVAVGQSWGGNVVLELARRHPTAVSGAACVDGGTIELSGRFPTWEECWATLAPPRLAGTRVEVFEDLIRRLHPDWPDEAIRGTLANLSVDAEGRVAPHLARDRHERVLRELWEHHSADLFGEVVVPVLLLPVTSGHDPAEDEKHADVELAAAALPRARTHWFTQRDHDVHAQAPNEVAQVLLAAVTDGFFEVTV